MSNPISFRCPVDECSDRMELRSTDFISTEHGEMYVDVYRCGAGHSLWLRDGSDDDE